MTHRYTIGAAQAASRPEGGIDGADSASGVLAPCAGGESTMVWTFTDAEARTP